MECSEQTKRFIDTCINYSGNGKKKTQHNILYKQSICKVLFSGVFVLLYYIEVLIGPYFKVIA